MVYFVLTVCIILICAIIYLCYTSIDKLRIWFENEGQKFRNSSEATKSKMLSTIEGLQKQVTELMQTIEQIRATSPPQVNRLCDLLRNHPQGYPYCEAITDGSQMICDMENFALCKYHIIYSGFAPCQGAECDEEIPQREYFRLLGNPKYSGLCPLHRAALKGDGSDVPEQQ